MKVIKIINDVYNILIVPAGSGIAISAILKLKEDKKMRIFSADADLLAPGLHLSDKGYEIPNYSDPLFYQSLYSIIKKEHIDVLIPALDTFLLDFSKKSKEFKKLGVETLISIPNTIRITRDKWLTYNKLKDIIPFPKSFIQLNDIDVDFPLFIKPREGSGSKDAHLVLNNKDLDFHFNSINEPIIQEYLPGKEYTVDCLADYEGNLIICIPRERIETKCGISIKGRIIKSKEIEEIALKISSNLKFFGPFFFQLKEDYNGTLKIMEINSRISGTMSLSSASGVNIHSLAVRMLMGEKIEIPRFEDEIYITRFWKDIILKVEDLKKIEKF